MNGASLDKWNYLSWVKKVGICAEEVKSQKIRIKRLPINKTKSGVYNKDNNSLAIKNEMCQKCISLIIQLMPKAYHNACQMVGNQTFLD